MTPPPRPRASTPTDPASPAAADPAAERVLRGLVLAVLLFATACSVWVYGRAPAASLAEPGSVDPGYRVNVNEADAVELQLLHGVGPALADNLIRHRADHGPYRQPSELLNVKLIGPATLSRIEPWITFAPVAEPSNPDDVVQAAPHADAERREASGISHPHADAEHREASGPPR